MNNKIVLVLVVLVLIFGIGFIVSHIDYWEKEDMVKGSVTSTNTGEGGGYKIQILERSIG